MVSENIAWDFPSVFPENTQLRVLQWLVQYALPQSASQMDPVPYLMHYFRPGPIGTHPQSTGSQGWFMEVIVMIKMFCPLIN